jgi:hypothetical protein
LTLVPGRQKVSVTELVGYMFSQSPKSRPQILMVLSADPDTSRLQTHKKTTHSTGVGRGKGEEKREISGLRDPLLTGQLMAVKGQE